MLFVVHRQNFFLPIFCREILTQMRCWHLKTHKYVYTMERLAPDSYMGEERTKV
jgi:hypothetical protein